MTNRVIDWLLASDPAIRWQVMRDLLDAPEGDWRLERAKVEVQGWGARLFELQDNDGQWGGGAFMPASFTEQNWRDEGQPWTATCWVLAELRDFGLEPTCACARRTVRLVGENARWEHDSQPYWTGEVEECINGRTVAHGAYFGVEVTPIVQRLLRERQEDGGWNCERANGSRVSSFHSTINVLEGLLEYERSFGSTSQTQDARRNGEEYLLRRHLFRRLSTGEVADARYLDFTHPSRYRYDVLRALDYFRCASIFDRSEPEPRLVEAIERVRAKRQADGKWVMDWALRGRQWLDHDDGVGHPSRWITLRAMRVLRWWESQREARGVRG
jgi:hypothetical protein